jgi:hypothetical protein
MFKMGSHDPFGYFKHKSWPTKRHEVNYQFDYRPLNVKNCPDFLVRKWRATYRWKVLDDNYNFALDFTSIEGLHTKLQAPKVAGVLI